MSGGGGAHIYDVACIDMQYTCRNSLVAERPICRPAAGCNTKSIATYIPT